MTVTETRPEVEEPKRGRANGFIRSFVLIVLNLAVFFVAGFFTIDALGNMADADAVSDLENNVIGVSALFFWSTLIVGGIVSLYVAAWVYRSFEYHYGFDWQRPVPVWGPVTFLVALALIGSGMSAWLYAIPVNHTVRSGEIRITRDGTILTEGQSIAGDRHTPTSVRIPLSDTGLFSVRVPMSESDWVSTQINISWTAAVTPELRELISANPPDLSQHGNGYYLGHRINELLTPEMGRLIRAEARPGQTAIGEVSGWSQDQASVPMDVRLGLQLEDNQAIRPSWLRALSVRGVSVGDWNRQEPAP